MIDVKYLINTAIKFCFLFNLFDNMKNVLLCISYDNEMTVLFINDKSLDERLTVLIQFQFNSYSVTNRQNNQFIK